MNTEFTCSSCSKESYDTVPISRIIERLDELFQKNDLSAVDKVLEYWDNEAKRLKDQRGLLEILNEKIGYYRRTGNKEKGLLAVDDAFALIEMLGLDGQISAGTVYLNGATTMKAFGDAANSIKYYDKAREIYTRLLPKNDFRLAAFYNNVSSAYKDIGDYKGCEESCIKAISILQEQIGYNGEMAISYINLAHLYYEMDNLDERVYQIIEKAWELLRSEENIHDGNFAFICSKCYPSFGFFGYFEYERILKETAEKIYEGN